MSRLRWLVPQLMVFSLTVFCVAPSAQAQRGRVNPCPYAANVTYSYSMTRVWVPNQPAYPAPHSTAPTPAPLPRKPIAYTAPIPPTHPVEKPKVATIEHPTTVRKETTVEHKYPTTEETVHHSLTAHVQKTSETHVVTEKHNYDDVSHTKTTVRVAEKKPGTGLGHPEEHATVKTHEATLRSQLTAELRRYEERDHEKVHVEVNDKVTVTHRERKVTEHTVAEQKNTEKEKIHVATTPKTESPLHTNTPTDKEKPKETPEKTADNKEPTSTGGHWETVVKVTAHVDFQCGQCHHQSLPKQPLVTTNQPQCRRPTQSPVSGSPDLAIKAPTHAAPLDLAIKTPTRATPLDLAIKTPPRAAPLDLAIKTPMRTEPMFLEGRPQSPTVPPGMMSGPPMRPAGSAPGVFVGAPGRPLDLITVTNANTNRTATASFWEDDTRSPTPTASLAATPAPTAPTPKLPPVSVTGSDNTSRSLGDTQLVLLDPIFQAPAPPSIVAIFPPVQDDNGTGAEVVLDPPALPPLVTSVWPAVNGQ